VKLWIKPSTSFRSVLSKPLWEKAAQRLLFSIVAPISTGLPLFFLFWFFFLSLRLQPVVVENISRQDAP